MKTDPAFITRSLALTPLPTYARKGGALVLMFASDKDSNFLQSLTGNIAPSLLANGFRLASIDLPAHGADQTPGVDGLQEWRNRIEAGNTTLFSNFCKQVSRLIDNEGVTDVSIYGQSRGAYCAAHCAASDPRVKRVFMAAPVTDLQRLTEFQGYTVNQGLFGLGQFTSILATKQIRIRIASNDTRVFTDAAATFAANVGAQIEIVPSSVHVVPDNGQCASWLSSLVPL